MGRLGYAKLPGQLDVLQNDWVLWTATILLVAEFVADKVPVFDSIWDAVHSFVRIPAGAVLATAAFAQYDPKIQVIAFLIGGGLAATSHTTKSTARAFVNASPEPASNWFLSLLEDVLSTVQTFLAVFIPWIALAMVVGSAAMAIWLLPKIFKRLSGRKNRTQSS